MPKDGCLINFSQSRESSDN